MEHIDLKSIKLFLRQAEDIPRGSIDPRHCFMFSSRNMSITIDAAISDICRSNAQTTRDANAPSAKPFRKTWSGRLRDIMVQPSLTSHFNKDVVSLVRRLMAHVQTLTM